MPERQRFPETTTNEPDGTDDVAGRLTEQATNASQLESDQPFTRYGPRDNEVNLDDVRKFLDHPPSLPVEKIPSLVEYYGHVAEVASRLVSRDDCPPQAISSTCRLHGNNPVFASYLIKHKGQLADDDNRHLHEANRHDWTLTINQVYYQQLPEDINRQIYSDYNGDKYILLAMIHRQSNLPPELVRQFYAGHNHDPEFAIALAAGQRLPEDIIGQSFNQHKNSPRFVAALFQRQTNLPVDLIHQAYYDYDRSFEPVLANGWAAADNFDDSLVYVLEGILPDGGITIDLSNMRQIRVGRPSEKTGEIPGSIIDRAHQEARVFMGFIINLLAQNQLDEEMVRSVYNDLGDKPAVAMAMFGFQRSIPLNVIRQACEDHGQNIMFVEVLFKNHKSLPPDIIEPIYHRHRWNPLFNGDWLADQANLPAEKQQEASHWRRILDLEAEALKGPTKESQNRPS